MMLWFLKPKRKRGWKTYNLPTAEECPDQYLGENHHLLNDASFKAAVEKVKSDPDYGKPRNQWTDQVER